MPKILSLLLLALLFQTCGSANSEPRTANEEQPEAPTVVEAPADNHLSEAMAADGWTVLFDGNDLQAWRGYNKEDVAPGWAATDGELQFTPGEGNGGDLITRKQYTDFEFQLDYQLIEGGNSGIFYLVHEVADMPIYFNAPEYQLLHDDWWATEHDEQPIHFTSANYDLEAPQGGQLNPIGEWNTAKIVKRGNTVQHYLNGTMTVEYELHSPEWTAQYEASKFKNFEGAAYAQANTGSIGLQDHGEFVRFRNLFVKEL